MANSSLMVVVDGIDPLNSEGREGHELLSRLEKYIHGANNGAKRVNAVFVWEGNGDAPAQAVGELALSSVVATDACTVGGVTFTAVASNPDEEEFEVGQDDGETAENLAAAINAHPDLAGVVTAEADGTDVIITCLIPGVVGNHLHLSSADASITATAFSGGSGGNVAPRVVQP